MKISTRLTILFSLVAILPMLVSGLWGLRTLQQANRLAVEQGEEILLSQGEEAILKTAQDVARQIALYLDSHPDVSLTNLSQLESNAELAEIAVQPVGRTGYTAVFDEEGITHFHVNPDLIGMDMSTLADDLPQFWAIFAASLDGSTSAGYYDWQDADEKVRRKFMGIVPVGSTPLRVAATTYIEEFSLRHQLDGIRKGLVNQLIVAFVVVAVLAVLGATLLARRLSQPIHQMAHAATQIANGDLRIEPPSAPVGELRLLATAFAQLTANLRSLIQRVRTMSVSLNSAAGQVMMTQRRYTTNSDEQATAVNSAGTAVEELAHSSAQIADTARQVVVAAGQTQANARRGVEAMADTVDCLERIAAGNDAAVGKVRVLGNLAREIGMVMDLIEDIAAQTKMIAFNASIEASAAGEAGRRFAIVAGEVRRLASSVSLSTERIRTQVEEIQITTNELVIASERESKEIEGGIGISDGMAGLLDQILHNAEETSLAVEQISLSTQQQRTATEQLLAELRSLTAGASAVAAGSRETMAEMENLVAMAQDLQVAVGDFKLPETAPSPTIAEQENDAEIAT